MMHAFLEFASDIHGFVGTKHRRDDDPRATPGDPVGDIRGAPL
jgi:hypothetical protein